MRKTSNGREFAVVSAICYIIFTLYIVITDYSTIMQGTPLYVAGTLLLWISLIGITISLFFAKKKAVCFAACACAVAHLLTSIDHMNSNAISEIDIWGIIIYAVLSIILYLAEKKNKIVGKISFLAGIISLISCLNYLAHFFIFTGTYTQNWEREVFYIVEFGALMYAGFWIKEDYSYNSATKINK